MKNLFNYSRVATAIVFVLSALLAIELIMKNDLWYFRATPLNLSSYVVLPCIGQITVLCFFMLIYIGSAKGSVLRKPTLIGIISVSLGICNMIFHTEFLGNILIGLIVSLGLFWSLLNVIKYTNSRLVEVLCMIFSILNIPTFIGVNTLYMLFGYNIIWPIFEIISFLFLSAFYYAFAKNINN